MKRTLLFVLMCIGGCALDSTGIAFAVACAMVLIPAIVLIVGELSENEVNANIDENILVDYATREDMVEFV